MRDQLVKYIDLLFAGARDADDIKQEILQNTLDRYDDLIAQGKTPESAYSQSISGIGDISELLNGTQTPSDPQANHIPAPEKKESRNVRLSRAAAIMFFILCPIPVIVLENVLGICLLLAMVAAGVGLLIFFGRSEQAEEKDTRSTAHRILHGITWGCGLALYFWLSFATEAWYITWLMFPIIGAVCGFISAFFDLNKAFLSAVVRIILFGLLSLILSAVLFGYSFAVDIFERITDSYTQQEDFLENQETISESSGSVAADKVRNIRIQWVSGSITILPGDVQNIQFEETGSFPSGDKMVWKQTGDDLTIEFCRPNISLHGITSTFSKDLTVTVPRNWVGNEVEIDSISARVQISQLQTKDVELVNVSGSCDFTGCRFEEFFASTVSGNVRFEGSLLEMDLDTTSADCTAKLSGSPREIELDSVSGNLTLVLEADCGFTLDQDSISGDFSSDYPTTSSKNRHTYGNGSCKITVDTVSGDVKIQKP